MRKVLAFQSGKIEHETQKAVKMSGRWYPKSAIVERLTSDNDADVLILAPWFVRKNQYIVKNELGIAINRGIIVDGNLLFQGDDSKIGRKIENETMTMDQADELFDKLIADGMNAKDASREVRNRMRNEQ